MTRADVTISVASSLQKSSQSSYMVKTPAGVIYSIFPNQSDSNLYWTKSSDGGFTWTDAILIKVLGGVSSGYTVWYDKWTPGDTGTKIYISYFDQANDDVGIRVLDTADDSLSTEVVIFAGATTSSAANTCISIVKAIGGNLYVAFDMDAGTETGFYRSTDGGGTWAARTDVNESTSDYYLLAPGFASDTQDIICIFWDRSANEISRKLYDDSGNSWSETSIATGMTALSSGVAGPNFSITVDDTNNKILLAAWTAADTANADLRFWSLDESSITERTNIVLNSVDDQGMVALSLATDTNILYAFYGGKSDGSETFASAINIYYKTSSDLGVTWESETRLTLITRGYEYLMSFPLFTGDFGSTYFSQTANVDALLFSVLIPTAGGSQVAPILGDFILQ